MLKKRPKSTVLKYVRTGAKIAFVAEAVIFALSYGVWYRLNTSRDFRFYMHNNFNWVLDGTPRRTTLL
ncbi:uncharacterized protein [Anabrus simplex]|uniref:uncharacterized protein isoform X2 n=1 Tax=Anabrus simplex TaxID=316456 RepID=UPI0034DD64E8